MITCNNCQELLEKYLCEMPNEWRTQIVEVICKFLNIETNINCKDVTKCETLTTLSAFTVNDGEVCIDYKNEKGQTVHRCFSITAPRLQLDPKCITSQENWDSMTWVQQIQLLIDHVCSCIRYFPLEQLYVYHFDGFAGVGTIVGNYDVSLTDATYLESMWTIGVPGIGMVNIMYYDTVTLEFLSETINVDTTSSTTFWGDINGWLLMNNFNDISFDITLNRWKINDPHNSTYIHIS